MPNLWRPYFLAAIFTVLSSSSAQRYQEKNFREELNKDPERSDEIALDLDEQNHPDDVSPSVNFQCKGRPSGYYADPQFGCEVFHYCHRDGTRVTIVCSENRSKLHKICQFQTVAVKACGETEMYFVLPDTQPQKKGKGTTASGINDATDFKLPLVIPRPTLASYVVSHPTKPLRIKSRSDDQEMPSKVFPSSAMRKASSPFRLSSGPLPKVNVFEPYTPIRFDLKDGEKVFEVFARSGKTVKLHSEIEKNKNQGYSDFKKNENVEANESNNDSLQRRVPLKQKRIQVLKTVFPSGINKKIHLHLSSKTPKTYYEGPSYHDNKTDYRQYYIAKPGITKSNGSIYLIEVYHKDFDNDPVGDYSSYRRKAKNVSFLLSSEKSDLKETLAKPKAKKNPRKKREVATEVSHRRPLAVIYAKRPEATLSEVISAPNVGSSRNQDQENIKVSVSPNVVPLDLSAIPIAIRSLTSQESNSFPRNNPRASNSGQPQSTAFYDNSEEQSPPQLFSEQRNIYYVSPERLPQNPRSQNLANGNSILRPIVNPSYRITEDQQADPSQSPSRLHTENKVVSSPSKEQNNLPRLNTFSPGTHSTHEVRPQSENDPKILNRRPQSIAYFADPVESHYFLDPQGIVQGGQFPHFNPFGYPNFVSSRPLQNERLIPNIQQPHPVPRLHRVPSTSSRDIDAAPAVKESSEEEKSAPINTEGGNTQNGNRRPQSQITGARQPNFGIPSVTFRQALLPGFSPFAPNNYNGPNLQQDMPLGIPPFGFIGPHEDRSPYSIPNLPQQFLNDRRPQAPFRGTPTGTRNLGRPTDTSSSEENSSEHNDRFKTERNQHGRHVPQQGVPQQFSPNLSTKPDSSEERTRPHDSRNIQRPNYQQFTPQDVRLPHLNVPDVSSGVRQNNLQRPIHSQNHPNIILPQGLLHPHPRPFEISEVNHGVSNEQYQGRPHANRLSQVHRPLRPTHTSEEEIIRRPGDFSRRPPSIAMQTHQGTRASGPSSVKYVDSDSDEETYSRRPTRPATSEAQNPRLHRPPEVLSPRPQRPSETQSSRLHPPSESQSSRPHRPPEVTNYRSHRPSDADSARPNHLSEAQISRPNRPPEVQSTRPNHLSEAHISRLNRPSEVQSARPNHLPEAQISRPNRPSEAHSSRPLRPVQIETTRTLRPSEIESQRTQRQPFTQANRNVRPQNGYEGIPHHLNKYGPEDERVLIHHPTYTSDRENTGIQDGKFQGSVSESTAGDYRPNRYVSNQERLHQKPKQTNNYSGDRSYISPSYPTTKPFVSSPDNQVHYGNRNPSDERNRNPQRRPYTEDSRSEYSVSDHRNPPQTSYSRHLNPEDKTRINPIQTYTDESRRPSRPTTVPYREYSRQKQNENQGNSVNVISSAGDYGSRQYRPPTSVETQDDKSSFIDRNRYRQTTQRPEAVRSSETLIRDGVDSERGTHFHRTNENEYDKNSRGSGTRHQDNSDESVTRASVTTTTVRPQRKKPTPPRPTFPAFPTFPPPIRRPIPTIPTPTKSEEEISPPEEEAGEVDPYAHMRARQNSRPRIAPTVSTISYSADIGPYLPEEKNELQKTIKEPTTTTSRPRSRKRAKGRVRRPKPTVRTTTETNEAYEEPPSTVTYSDDKVKKYGEDKNYGERSSSEHTTVKPEPLSTSHSNDFEVTTKSDGFGNRINLFSRPLNRRPSTYKRLSVTTQSSSNEPDGSEKRITAVPITRRRRPYKKRIRTKTTTTTESSVLTEAESIARSDEEIESLLYVGRETTVPPIESPVEHETSHVLERNTEPTVLATATTVSIIVNENPSQSDSSDQKTEILDGNKRSVLDKFKSRPRLLRFGRPKPRSGTGEQSSDYVVAESKSSETTVSTQNGSER